MSGVRFPDAPPRILALPTDHRGFPVPWFVAWIDGEPDFRVVAPGRQVEGHNKSLCWICGQRLGRHRAFTIGPMCAVNRVSAEPPSHVDCAVFAAKACPFLANPRMRRNLKDLPEEAQDAPGITIARNPGVALVWVTKGYTPFRADHGYLFDVGEPERVHWFAQGREATHDEVMESIASGLPILQAEAAKGGPKAMDQLRLMTRAAMRLVPEAA